MFLLRNITSFGEFKKMNEGVDIGTEFSNTTKLKDSLVGQAVSGIFGLIKNGIDAIRLEYFKKKLENEYFAGVLRYCKTKNIDLKNPQPPPLVSGNTDSNPAQNEIVEIKNDILLLRFNVTGWNTSLNAVTIAINGEIGSIPTGTTLHDDFELIRDKLIPDIININQKFLDLNTGNTTTLDSNLDIIKSTISDINTLTLNSISPPDRLKYLLSQEEKDILAFLVTSLEVVYPVIRNKVLVENHNFEDYNLINEKINNDSGDGICFILGDELSEKGVKNFLKDQGVDEIIGKNGIKFKQLASIFDDKMKSEATNSVNKNAIYRIAASVSNIITEKKSNSKKGTTKGDPTGFMSSWQKKVSDVKGEFSKFLNVDEIDPITMKGLTAFTQNPKNTADINVDSTKLKEINRIYKIILYGGPSGIVDREFRNFGVIRMMRGTTDFTGPLFELEPTLCGTFRAYKYIGSLDFDKMIVNSDTTHNLITDDTTKSWFWKSNHINIIPFLLNKPKSPTTNKNLAGIYFVFSGTPKGTPDGEPKKFLAKIFYVYMSNMDAMIGTPTSVEVYSLDNTNKLNLISNPTTIKIDEIVDKFEVSVGKTFEINSPLKDGFNDTIKHVTPDLFSFVRFKT